MAEQTLTLEQAQDETLKATSAKIAVVAFQKRDLTKFKDDQAKALKPYTKAITTTLNAEMSLRRKLAKTDANKAADEAAAESKRADDQAKAELDDEAAQAKAEVAQSGSL